MNDRLLDYLMGQLEPDAVRALEGELAGSPELRAQLARLQRALAPLAEVDAPAPPDLVARTLAFVQQHGDPGLPLAPTRPLRNSDAPFRPRSRWLDWVLAASILVVVGGLAIVGVGRAWDQANVRSCQQNLATLWTSLAIYGQIHHGTLPAVHQASGVEGLAAAYIPMLYQAGAAVEPLPVGCPAQCKKSAPPTTLSVLEQLRQDDPARFRQQMRDLGGDYAYTLGYRLEGTLHGLRLDSGEAVPLLADAPAGSGMGNSPNHAGRGQNILFVGGNVRWLTTTTHGPQCDEIYHNRQRQIRPGLDPSDWVLGAGTSCAAP